MSEENIEIVRRAMAAFLDRDLEAWVDCSAEDVEMLLPRNLLEGGSYKGHDEIRRAFADAFGTWEDFRFVLEDIRAIDDQVVLLGQTTAVGRGEAPTVNFQGGYVFEMREGKIVHFRPYQSHREALEAAGLSE